MGKAAHRNLCDADKRQRRTRRSQEKSVLQGKKFKIVNVAGGQVELPKCCNVSMDLSNTEWAADLGEAPRVWR